MNLNETKSKFTRIEWVMCFAMLACLVGIALMAKHLGDLGKQMDDNGGVKAVVERVWEGKPRK